MVPFVLIHSIYSDKDIIINTNYIAKIEERLDGGTDIWLVGEGEITRVIKTAISSHAWMEFLNMG